MKLPRVLNPLQGTQFSWLLPFGWLLIKCAALTAPITLEVFLHYRFGVRTGKCLIKGFLLLLVAATAFKAAFAPAPSPLFTNFIVAYVAFAITQWVGCRVQVRNEHVHSYRTGAPWPLWDLLPISGGFVERYLEPALCFIVALILKPVDQALAHWLLFATIALFFKEQVRRAQLRAHQLDALDSRTDTNDRAPHTRTENEPFAEVRPAPPRATHRTITAQRGR